MQISDCWRIIAHGHKRLRYAMLRRVGPGKQGSTARRTHTGVAKCTVETKATLFKKCKIWQICRFPAFMKMLRCVLLIGNNDDNIGMHADLSQVFVKIHSMKCIRLQDCILKATKSFFSQEVRKVRKKLQKNQQTSITMRQELISNQLTSSL
jgi:hypothetical protein